MDLVTGAEVAVTVIVAVPRERVWELVTAVDRFGEWSPEATAGTWCASGDRFIGRNRFPSGLETTVDCVVTAAVPGTVFAWDVLDADGAVGSAWRYDLSDGATPGTTVVRHTFRHGPGRTGARDAALADPRALDERLTTLCRNMLTTIAAMTTA